MSVGVDLWDDTLVFTVQIAMIVDILQSQIFERRHKNTSCLKKVRSKYVIIDTV